MIRAAMKLIAERGLAKTTLADVGVEAGYSRGLPVERFGTKTGLIDAMVDSVESWFSSNAPEMIRDLKGLDAVRARISAHVENGLATPVVTRVIYYLYIEASFGLPEIRPRMRALSRAFADGFRQHLSEARDSGEIPADSDIDQIATIIVGMIRGVFIEWVLSDGETNIRALAPTLHAMATEAIRQVSGQRADLRVEA